MKKQGIVKAMPLKSEVKRDGRNFATTHAPRRLLGSVILATALLAFSTLHAAITAGDNPMEILQKARLNEANQSIELDGQVRHGEATIPFRLVLEGGAIKYVFTKPEETITLQLGDKTFRLVDTTGDGDKRLTTDAQLDRPVRGSVITYEDLAMRFLYWPVAKIVGEDIQLTRNCWKLRVEPGSASSQYGYVLLWIEKQSSALVRIETYDKAGVLLKRFEVKSVQKLNGGYILKQMRIQQMQNGKPADPEPTYLEIQKPGES